MFRSSGTSSAYFNYSHQLLTMCILAWIEFWIRQCCLIYTSSLMPITASTLAVMPSDVSEESCNGSLQRVSVAMTVSVNRTILSSHEL